MSRVLILEPTKSVRKTLCELIKVEGFDVLGVDDMPHAIAEAQAAVRGRHPFDLLIIDSREHPDCKELVSMPFIVISENPSVDEAIAVARLGACDYICRPYDMNRLLRSVREGVEHHIEPPIANDDPPATRRRRARSAVDVQEIVGESQAVEQLRRMIDRVAPSEARVLIMGENGTGKELVARRLHQMSRRAGAQFVEVNCAAIPSELIESELFGHEKGAFTSAVKQRRGKFEQADGGTLFLDEIGDMSLAAQAKVLRALQERRITRVGSDRDIEVDVRVVAATNKDLRAEIDAGNFREDLYHRLGVIILRVEPLRNRASDIPLLVDHFLVAICGEYGVELKNISSEAIEMLKSLEWRGNIRELRNVVERLVILADGAIDARDVKEYCYT